MIKRVWAGFSPLSYRARERYLDEMARRGWRLQKEGFWGMRFVEEEPKERYHRTAALLQLVSLALLILSVYYSLTDDWSDSLFDRIFAYPSGVMTAGLLLAFMLAVTAADLLACLRFHWAEIDERPYEPLMQGAFWYALQKTLIVLYIGIIIIGSIWLIR